MHFTISQNFNDVCLAHLFTYRDFQGKYIKEIFCGENFIKRISLLDAGTIGLAYVGDPSKYLFHVMCLSDHII